MLVFYGFGRVKKEKIQDFEKGLIPFLKGVSTEDGILDFKVFRQNDEPTRYLFYETYRNQEAFDIHRKTEHVDEFYEVMMDSFAEDPIKGFWEEVASK
ncbi:MAG: antibiotic biosynthesis monooxygenase [Spirochaetales bacterium]|nr:antibiotic biosynthesis monooxygenase [Spirochaetales bacterium]